MAVEGLAARGLSERAGCELVGISRSGYRYRCAEDEDDSLEKRLARISREHPRAGYRMAWAHLRREGERVNHKRVWRLWKEMGLCQPRRRRRR